MFVIERENAGIGLSVLVPVPLDIGNPNDVDVNADDVKVEEGIEESVFDDDDDDDDDEGIDIEGGTVLLILKALELSFAATTSSDFLSTTIFEFFGEGILPNTILSVEDIGFVVVVVVIDNGEGIFDSCLLFLSIGFERIDFSLFSLGGDEVLDFDGIILGIILDVLVVVAAGVAVGRLKL